MHRFFSINPGEACPQTPLPALGTYRTRIHAFCESKTLTLTLKLVATTLSIGWNYFRCVKVCQVHNDTPPPALAWLRVFCARMKIFHVLNIAPPPPPNMESWMRPCGSIATVSNIWDPDQARRFVWSDLGQPVSKDYYFAGFTTDIIPNSWPRILFD